jgi:hypothetical protein
MVKYSNEKDGCFKNLKEKVSCRVKDKTPKPIKAYVVKITKDMKKKIVDPDNNIDVQVAYKHDTMHFFVTCLFVSHPSLESIIKKYDFLSWF